jgi:hypothetical protein
MKTIIKMMSRATVVLLVLAVQGVSAQDTAALIALAKSSAPGMISDNATVMYRGTVLEQGSNDWVCLPETLPDDGSPMCNDRVWMDMMQAMGAGEPFEAQGLGFSYMLQGDAGVSNSNPMHPMGKDAPDFIQEGAHLMIIVPKAMLQGITDDPHSGGPYVMWGDTPYAHIMIPIDNR